MTALLLITGPPGAGKSTVARALADQHERSILVEGDAFFGFLAAGAIPPWLPDSRIQNEVVTGAAAAATARFVAAGYPTIFEGVVGPWMLPRFLAATGLCELDYVILLPSVACCWQRVEGREGHGFDDETATRKMHHEFTMAEAAERHLIRDDQASVQDIVDRIRSSAGSGALSFRAPDSSG